MHTCLHLLSAVLDYPVTGGQVSDRKGRLDFDIPEATLDKEHITDELNRLIGEDHAVTSEWITDEELATQPDLVKTMSVKPPSGLGRVRLLRVGEAIDQAWLVLYLASDASRFCTGQIWLANGGAAIPH